jgi:outer membrane protein W
VKKAIARPYLGAGVLTMFASVDAGANAWNGGDSDHSFGFYGNAGLFFKVGSSFNIGIDGRIVRGTSVTLAGTELDANYERASMLFGFSWGE